MNQIISHCQFEWRPSENKTGYSCLQQAGEITANLKCTPLKPNENNIQVPSPPKRPIKDSGKKKFI